MADWDKFIKQAEMAANQTQREKIENITYKIKNLENHIK